jgi:hypothetical protein
MNIHELKARYPRLYSEIFARGVHAERRRALAAELIAGAPENRDQAPVNFARVPCKVAGEGGPSFVVPIY